MLEERLEQEIKTALLGGDTFKVTTLRGLKASLLNIKVAQGKRESGLTDDEVIQAFIKEAKKCQESADLYRQGGNNEKAEAELYEKKIIQEFLPEQVDEATIKAAIEAIVVDMGHITQSDMGKIIGQAKAKLGASADGATIARLTKEKLQ
jgi:uncharacterized protein YqeY